MRSWNRSAKLCRYPSPIQSTPNSPWRGGLRWRTVGQIDTDSSQAAETSTSGPGACHVRRRRPPQRPPSCCHGDGRPDRYRSVADGRDATHNRDATRCTRRRTRPALAGVACEEVDHLGRCRGGCSGRRCRSPRVLRSTSKTRPRRLQTRRLRALRDLGQCPHRSRADPRPALRRSSLPRCRQNRRPPRTALLRPRRGRRTVHAPRRSVRLSSAAAPVPRPAVSARGPPANRVRRDADRCDSGGPFGAPPCSGPAHSGWPEPWPLRRPAGGSRAFASGCSGRCPGCGAGVWASARSVPTGAGARATALSAAGAVASSGRSSRSCGNPLLPPRCSRSRGTLVAPPAAAPVPPEPQMRRPRRTRSRPVMGPLFSGPP